MNLSESHRKKLASSGLSTSTIMTAGLHTGSPAEVREILGYGTGCTGLIIPYDDGYARVRIDNPGPDGKRYRSPKGRGNRLYIPPGLGPEILKDSAKTLYLTEGEFKALKATQEGFPCVALPGVWSWKRKVHGKSLVIPDFENIEWRGHAVVVVYDSDLIDKPSVAWAEHDLVQELRQRGAQVFVVRLPTGEQGEKYGLDDYLLAEGVEKFKALPMLSPEQVNERPLVVAMSTVAPEPVEWCWPNRLAFGKLALLVGDPGVGKSYLSLDVIARASKGATWPDGERAPLCRSVILSAEDGAADTIRPRLDLLGADLDNVALLVGLVSMTRDLMTVREALIQTGAKILVVDPVAAFLGGVESNRDAAVRAALAPLSAIAEQLRVAVLAVMHFTKDEDRRLIARASGSLAFAAAARTMLVAMPGQNDPDGRTMLLGSVKNNLGARADTLAYVITDEGICWQASPAGHAADFEQMTKRNGTDFAPKLRTARAFLLKALTAGPVSADEMVRMARDAGITERTLRSAKVALGVTSERAADAWSWRLAGDAAA